jgi:hypothetical protein
MAKKQSRARVRKPAGPKLITLAMLRRRAAAHVEPTADEREARAKRMHAQFATRSL